MALPAVTSFLAACDDGKKSSGTSTQRSLSEALVMSRRLVPVVGTPVITTSLSPIASKTEAATLTPLTDSCREAHSANTDAFSFGRNAMLGAIEIAKDLTNQTLRIIA